MRRLLQQKFLAPRNESLETVSAFTSSEDVPSLSTLGTCPSDAVELPAIFADLMIVDTQNRASFYKLDQALRELF
jgi:hypothetical protein